MAFQGPKFSTDDAQGLAREEVSSWDPVLLRALASAPNKGRALLFLEDREDLSVELDTLAPHPVVRHGRTRGLALETGDGRFTFRADPEPGDAERLVRWLERPWPERQEAEKHADGAPGSHPGQAAWLSSADALAAVQALIDATEGLRPGLRAVARWIGFEQRVRLATSVGQVLGDRRRGRRIRLLVDVARGGRAGRSMAEAVLRPEDAGLEQACRRLAAQAVARAEQRLGARSLPAGERRVVFAPGVGGILLHEIVGHALEADAVLGGASWLAGRAGAPCRLPPALVVLDDPRRGRAPWRFDDEGQPARAVPLLHGGRVAGWLHDGSTAAEAGRAPTGHGRRASFRERARPRMGCTFMAAGRLDARDALQGVEEGIYVRRMEAASADTRTGHALFRVTDADQIRHGRLGAPLVPHLLAIEGSAALPSVECIASDLEFDTCVGSCLNHGQPMSVSVGAPTFRIGSASVFF